MENGIGVFNMSLGEEVGGWDISFGFSTWAPAWRSTWTGPRWAFSAHAFLVAPRHSSTSSHSQQDENNIKLHFAECHEAN